MESGQNVTAYCAEFVAPEKGGEDPKGRPKTPVEGQGGSNTCEKQDRQDFWAIQDYGSGEVNQKTREPRPAEIWNREGRSKKPGEKVMRGQGQEKILVPCCFKAPEARTDWRGGIREKNQETDVTKGVVNYGPSR